MECPFSPARLRELTWTETPRWTPAQVATLARAMSAELVTEADVLAWLAEAGIALPSDKPALAAKPKPRRSPRPRARKQSGEGMVTQPCEQCGALVSRTPDRIGGRVFCCRAHNYAWRREERDRQRRLRKCQVARDLTPLKLCRECPEGEGLKPLAEFCVDVHKPDGRARICRACAKRKADAYYRANQERLKARAQERKKSLKIAPDS